MTAVIFTSDIQTAILTIANELEQIRKLKQEEIKNQEKIIELLEHPSGYKIR